VEVVARRCVVLRRRVLELLSTLLSLALASVLVACGGDPEPSEPAASAMDAAARLLTAEELGYDWTSRGDPHPVDGMIPADERDSWGPRPTGMCRGTKPQVPPDLPWEAFRHFELMKPPMLDMPAAQEPQPVRITIEEVIATGSASQMRNTYEEYAAGITACWGKAPSRPYTGTFNRLEVPAVGDARIGTDATYRPGPGYDYRSGKPAVLVAANVRTVIVLVGDVLLAAVVEEWAYPPNRRWTLEHHLDSATLGDIVEKMVDKAT
jgi:hypothetical protein